MTKGRARKKCILRGINICNNIKLATKFFFVCFMQSQSLGRWKEIVNELDMVTTQLKWLRGAFVLTLAELSWDCDIHPNHLFCKEAWIVTLN